MVAMGGGVREEMEWEVGVSRCKLLYVEWINSKVPLYTPDDHIQHPVINHNGKEHEKVHKDMCMYNRITAV